VRRVGLVEVFGLGTLFAILCLISGELLTHEEAVILAYTLWAISLLSGFVFIRLGFDYYRIKYSFALAFLVLIVALYEILALMIVLVFGGDARVKDSVLTVAAAASGLSPYFGVAIAGSLLEKLNQRRLVKAEKKPVPSRMVFIRGLRKVSYQLDKTMWSFLIFGMAYLTVFMLIPIGLVLAYSLIPPAGGAPWDNFYVAIKSNINLKPLNPQPWTLLSLPGGECLVVVHGVNYGPILNSIIVASIVTLVATILGTSIGFILARYKFPGHTLLRVLAIVPLFNTPFINAFAIRLLWSERGPISYLFKSLTGCWLKVDSIAGVALTQILTFYPIVYLNAYTAFINVDPSMEEQAENLGSKGFRVFRTVTLPLALPGIAAGSTLVFVFSLEDLMAPIVFNEKNFISYKIYSELTTTYVYGFVGPGVAALGVILLIYALMVFIAIRNYVGLRSYAMISRGGRWNPRIRKLGLLGKLVVYLVVFPIVVFTMMPQIMVVSMSIGVLKPYLGATGLVFELPQSLSSALQYFGRILMDPAVNRYILNTLTYAGVSVVLAVILAISVAYSVSRLKLKAVPSFLDALATSPLVIPGLVIVLGYYILLMGLAPILPGQVGAFIDPTNIALFQAWLVFIIAYSVRRLPYVVRSVYAGFQQVHENLEEAAMNLGAPRYKVVFGITMPFIVGYVLSGALLGFIYMATEVSTSITFGGVRPDQAPLTYYMAMTLAGAAGEGPMLVAAMGALLIAIQLAVVIAVVYIFKQRYAFIGI